MGYFNTSISDWEHAVEPFLIVTAIEQMPNELSMSLAAPDMINTNVTGIMLSDFAEMKFDFFCKNRTIFTKTKCNADNATSPLFNKSMSEVRNYAVVNESGLDFLICPKRDDDATHPSTLMDGSKEILDGPYLHFQDNCLSFLLTSGPSAEALVGRRESVINLSMDVQGNSECSRCNLILKGDKNNFKSRCEHEPVTEWCAQNQRLRSNIGDAYNLKKGSDLLSSQLWSPSDDFSPDCIIKSQPSGIELLHSSDSRQENFSSSIRSKSYRENKGNWVRPYHQKDIPEWSDNVGLNVDPEARFC